MSPARLRVVPAAPAAAWQRRRRPLKECAPGCLAAWPTRVCLVHPPYSRLQQLPCHVLSPPPSPLAPPWPPQAALHRLQPPLELPRLDVHQRPDGAGHLAAAVQGQASQHDLGRHRAAGTCGVGREGEGAVAGVLGRVVKARVRGTCPIPSRLPAVLLPARHSTLTRATVLTPATASAPSSAGRSRHGERPLNRPNNRPATTRVITRPTSRSVYQSISPARGSNIQTTSTASACSSTRVSAAAGVQQLRFPRVAPPTARLHTLPTRSAAAPCIPLLRRSDGNPVVAAGTWRNKAVAPLLPRLADAHLRLFNACVGRGGMGGGGGVGGGGGGGIA